MTAADADAALAGDAVEPEFGNAGDVVVCVELPCVPVFDCEVVGAFSDLSAAEGLLTPLFFAGGGAPAVEPGPLLGVGEPTTPTVEEELAPFAVLLAAGGGAEDGAAPAEGPLSPGTDCALPITELKINAEITRAVLETALNLMTFTFR